MKLAATPALLLTALYIASAGNIVSFKNKVAYSSIPLPYFRTVTGSIEWTDRYFKVNNYPEPTIKLSYWKELLNTNFNIETKDIIGRTALWMAVSGNNPGLVRLLLEKGAKLKTPRDSKYTILMPPIMEGNIEIVQLLIAYGANVNDRNKGDGQTALMRATEWDELEISQFLLDNGANIDSQDYDEKTALMIAVEISRSNQVRFLIQKGANL